MLASKLKRVDNAAEVTLRNGGQQLAHDLKVAVAGGLLCARHRLRTQLQLAHVTLEVHHKLNVAIAAGEGLHIPVEMMWVLTSLECGLSGTH